MKFNNKIVNIAKRNWSESKNSFGGEETFWNKLGSYLPMMANGCWRDRVESIRDIEKKFFILRYPRIADMDL